ncbi:MAG TPA: hypothetical protein DCS87_07370 [Rheinheimera sp.]|nr:hypothetical protein [Rheinheimera sp.]
MKAMWLMAVLLGSAVTVATVSPVQAQQATAAVQATDDLEASMKELSFQLKQAMQATEATKAAGHISKMQAELSAIQAYKFSSDKQTEFQEGLTKVANQLTTVQSLLADNKLAEAKTAMQQVDMLKKEYHKKRSPSIWELFFGPSDEE